MLLETKTKQRRNKPTDNVKGRRKSEDRRKKFDDLIDQLDRRNIQDRRNTKDRRLSKQKMFVFPVTQQGITVKGLNDEKEKLIRLIDKIISTSETLTYLSVTNLLKDAYFSLQSQNSKEKVLYQWYEGTIKHAKDDSEYAILVSQLNFILKQEMKDIIAVLDKYLSLMVDLEEEREVFINDMQNIKVTLKAYTEKKSTYIYPHYHAMLSLS